MLERVKANRAELARAVKRARERIRPEDVGLPPGQRRRVPGLRREEVALLAGISVDYVVRLEQSRGPQPSEQVLSSLARALRLPRDQRDHLFNLAGWQPPKPGLIDMHVRPGVLRMIDRFVDLPALVLSAKGDVLAWNAMSAALQGDWSTLPPERRNQPLLHFLPDPADGARSVIGGSEDERMATTVQAIANLRIAAGRYPDDPGLHRLLTDLQDGSAEFRTLWDDVDPRAWRNHTKTLVHPSLGAMTLECDTLHVPDTDQLLVVYSAEPGTPAAESLSLLRVIGTQDLAPDRLTADD